MLEARRIAHTVLVRVDCDDAFANRTLDAALRSAGKLDPRDVALATELSYGSLRRQVTLDHMLAQVSKRPLSELDAETRALLRLGAYQILYTRIPTRASVHATVELAKEFHKGRASGFVNGVLRALLRKKDSIRISSASEDPVLNLSLEASVPRWLAKECIAWFGAERARSLLESLDTSAHMSLRVNRLRATRTEAAEDLERTLGLNSEEAPHSPHGLYCPQAKVSPDLLRPEHGKWQAQDEAAQLVGYFAAPTPGSVVLDACAAPGGKTCHLAELMNNEGHIDAVDIHQNKLSTILEGAARLGLDIVHTHAADASKPLNFAKAVVERQGGYDLALIDAPCSALGILRRHPEIKGKRSEEDIARLAALQAKILRNVAALVKPAGVLVYAVCTMTPAEGPKQIERFLQENPEWRRQLPPGARPAEASEPLSSAPKSSPDDPAAPALERSPAIDKPLDRKIPSPEWWDTLLDANGDLVLAPDTHGTDGFYAARLVKSETP